MTQLRCPLGRATRIHLLLDIHWHCRCAFGGATLTTMRIRGTQNVLMSVAAPLGHLVAKLPDLRNDLAVRLRHAFICVQ